jgi:hypothetical protein
MTGLDRLTSRVREMGFRMHAASELPVNPDDKGGDDDKDLPLNPSQHHVMARSSKNKIDLDVFRRTYTGDPAAEVRHTWFGCIPFLLPDLISELLRALTRPHPHAYT